MSVCERQRERELQGKEICRPRRLTHAIGREGNADVAVLLPPTVAHRLLAADNGARKEGKRAGVTIVVGEGGLFYTYTLAHNGHRSNCAT